MNKDLLLVPLPVWNLAVAACLLGLAVLGSHFLREFLRDDLVIRLGGFEWDRQCACQYFLITGAGKTLSGVLPILMQFFQNQPRFGGLCIDVKGVLHEQVVAIARHQGRSNSVAVLEVRPPGGRSLLPSAAPLLLGRRLVHPFRKRLQVRRRYCRRSWKHEGAIQGVYPEPAESVGLHRGRQGRREGQRRLHRLASGA